MPSSSSRTPFLTIRAEGALLPVDLLQRIVESDHDLGGLTPESYYLSGEKLNEAINRSWNRLLGAWAAFSAGREKLPEGDAGTSLTREKWLLPLFDELDYGRLQITKAIEIEGKSYAISHGWGDVPIHLVGCGAELDKRMAGVTGAAKASPHSLVQELLNRSSERTWGFVSNGLRMRVLRDNASLTRQAYLEFDLEAMMNGEVYADFVVLWLVCHQSRVENRAEGCWLEVWSKAAQERGTRALEGLRGGVEKAIEALGKGFIGHPSNGSLRGALSSGAVSTLELYRQLLRLVYRLIFLFVAEDRQLLYDPASDAESRERYVRFYSTARLRRMAERVRGSRHADLYAALKLVMDKLGSGGAPELGLPALGGFLFSRKAMSALADCELSNEHLLEAVRSLAFTQDGRTRRAVDYKNLGSEELGSIYESLLELHPTVNTAAAMFELRSVSGSERKTTGSYYTPSSLIQVLLDSALEPVIEQAIKGVGNRESGAGKPNANSPFPIPSEAEQALLNLKVIDPACGSGHFLVAASHRLARRLASIRTGEGEPAPEAMRSALRAVISNCIYGVDINPMSVELCKVSLWMEALEPGKPLSFLDAHIQCGDSLVGVAPGLDISEIPDEAFNPAFGDDKATSSALKKRNKRERGGGNKDKAGQLGFRFDVTVLESMDDLARWLADRAAQVDAMPEDDSTQVQAKAQAFDDYHNAREYLKERLELDLWTASFFWSIPKADGETMLAPTQQELIQLRNGGELDARLVEKVRELADAEHLNFFHWKLAFPHVFSGENSGFDCVLGNPPWDMLQLDPQEYFSALDPNIANASSNSVREKMISELATQNKFLYDNYVADLHNTEAYQKFVHESGKFPLTSYGRINLMSLFAELGRKIVNTSGRTGLIVPTGIATDSFSQYFISDVIERGNLVSLYDFENRDGIFPAIDSRMKFCLLTLSNDRINQSDFCFFATKVEDLSDSKRKFKLGADEITLFNPNSKSIPVFRTRDDAEITRKIYQSCPVLVNDSKETDEWGLRWLMMYLVNTDSAIFRSEKKLLSEGFKLEDNLYKKQGTSYVPMYEGRMVHIYNHKYATWGDNGYVEFDTTKELKTQYWVPLDETEARLQKRNYTYKWLFGIRRIARNTDERTVIGTVFPRVAATYGLYLIMTQIENPKLNAALFGNILSLVFDYLCRGALTQPSITFEVFKQLPILPPSTYTPVDIDFIAPRVLELVYTAYDLRPFAEDMGYHGEPFRWDEGRRAQVRAELDAYYARLYGLTRDELRYILDPKEVHGDDFPGETFRVLKEKEVKQFGKYRTSRLVLEAWDQLVNPK